MMQIKVLGPGCPRCQKVEELTREALAETGLEAKITHIRNMDDIMAYPILHTPGLVINEVLKASGRIPRKEEIVVWIKELA